MTTSLAIDVGSSSVKAAVLVGTTPVSALVRIPFKTTYTNDRAEVDAKDILRAVAKAARDTLKSWDGRPKRAAIELIALSTMSPSWVAMDKAGLALTPVVTHQDRRSLAEAKYIEETVGKQTHLEVTGNRPVPGGISSTTAFWFLKNEKSTMRKARLVGHVQTMLIRALTGSAAMDPSNASFTGLYQTIDTDISTCTAGASGWDEQLCEVIGLNPNLLPPVLQADTIAGQLHAEGGRMLGLPRGTPVLTGLVDTSAALLLTGAVPGTMINVVGSTDVLAVVTDDPRPHENYLTRAMGVGDKYVSVATLPAAGSALLWAKQTLFREMPDKAFFNLLKKLPKAPAELICTVNLAGSRTAVDQPTATWSGLKLSTTREHLLAAMMDNLSQASAARLDLLKYATPTRLSKNIIRTGGTSEAMASLLHRYWPGTWNFADIPEAGLLGLGQLASARPA